MVDHVIAFDESLVADPETLPDVEPGHTIRFEITGRSAEIVFGSAPFVDRRPSYELTPQEPIEVTVADDVEGGIAYLARDGEAAKGPYDIWVSVAPGVIIDANCEPRPSGLPVYRNDRVRFFSSRYDVVLHFDAPIFTGGGARVDLPAGRPVFDTIHPGAPSGSVYYTVTGGCSYPVADGEDLAYLITRPRMIIRQ